MVDVAPIVIAVISFVGTLIAVAVSIWATWWSERSKRLAEFELERRTRLTESQKLIARYGDPILLAAQDLQSRLYNILEQGFLSNIRRDGEGKDNLLQYTSFLVGQYLSWTYILRRQAQFLRFETDEANKGLTKTLDSIKWVLSTDKLGPEGARVAAGSFMLWRGKQMAIGEVMTVPDDKELFCMGYAAFSQRWHQDEGFQKWFQSYVDDITKLALSRYPLGHHETGTAVAIPDHRLRILQHLLLDLIKILDEHDLRSESDYTKRCDPPPHNLCTCVVCTRQTSTNRKARMEATSALHNQRFDV